MASPVAVDAMKKTCSEEHLAKISVWITEWREISPFLGLTAADEQEILGTVPPLSVRSQKIAMLRLWRKKRGAKATYKRLCRAFKECEMLDLELKIQQLLVESSSSSSDEEDSLSNPPHPDPLITSYASYFRELYTSMSHNHTSQHWAHLPRCEFIQLAMIGAQGPRRGGPEEEMIRLAQQGKIETILHGHKESIELCNIFPLPARPPPLVVLPPPLPGRVCLIEGAPGGGKSTLALHICHQWAQNTSWLARFDLVVLAYLRDEAVQNASTLAYILPAAEDILKSSRSQIVSHIQASYGKDVLFIFDGWDEFPQHLMKDSLISTIIKQPHNVSLQQSTVLITSRPVSSGNLLHIADRRVEILGFTQHQIREYIGKALDGNSTDIQKLVQHLEEYPVIEGYCYIPLHSAILVHIFLTMKRALPTTLHELFCSLVLCCIVREHATREPDTSLPELSSLDDLTGDLKSILGYLCVLAYEGVMQNKVVFYQKHLCEFNLPANLSSLGLLQAVEGITLYSKSLSYNFLHLSVQELLAAYHISHMDPSKHIDVFKHMFGSSRFQAVLHFYSGFTKLANEAIQTYISTYSQTKSKIDDLLPLLHCFYEAQEPSLCKLVKSEFENDIELNNRLFPVDYLAIGFFLTSLLSTSSSDQPLRLKISDEFDNHKLKLLFLELSKMSAADAPLSSTRRMEIRFHGTTITIERAILIASLLEKSSFLSKLVIIMRQSKIDSNALRYIAEALQNANSHLATLQIFDQTNYVCSEHDDLALKKMCEMNKSLTHLNLSGISVSSCCYIFQGLQHNTTLVRLTLKGTGLVATEDIAKALTTMLQDNTTLEYIDLSKNHNFADAGARCVCQGLQHNTTLLHLNLSSTRITDVGAEYIAQALKSNCSLQTLIISNNYAITHEGFTCIDKSLKANTNSSLKLTK